MGTEAKLLLSQCLTETWVKVALLVTRAAPLSSDGSLRMGLGTSSLSTTLLRAPLSGSSDSSAPCLPLMVASCLPSLPAQVPSGVSVLQGRTELRLELVTTGRDDLGKVPRSGRGKGWRRALGVHCPEVGLEERKWMKSLRERKVEGESMVLSETPNERREKWERQGRSSRR